MNPPGTSANPFLGRVRPLHEHVCADVEFISGYPADSSRISCTCGWQGTVEGWSGHAPGLSVMRAWKDEPVSDVRNMRGRKMPQFAGPSMHMPDARVIAP